MALRIRLKKRPGRASAVETLARELEIDRSTVYEALKDPTFPLESDGSVDPDEARAWFLARRSAAARRRGGADPRDGGEWSPSKASKTYGGSAPDADGPPNDMQRAIIAAQADFRTARAEAERLRISKLRGDLVERRVVAEQMAAWARQFAKALLLVEGRMAHMLTKEARATLQAEHRACLQAFADAGKGIE